MYFAFKKAFIAYRIFLVYMLEKVGTREGESIAVPERQPNCT